MFGKSVATEGTDRLYIAPPLSFSTLDVRLRCAKNPLPVRNHFRVFSFRVLSCACASVSEKARSTKPTIRPGSAADPVVEDSDGIPHPFCDGIGDPELLRNSPVFDDEGQLADWPEGDEEQMAPPMRLIRRGRPPLPVSNHDPLLYPTADDLSDCPIRETKGRERFAAATPRDFREAMETSPRFLLSALMANRLTDRDARRMFLPDLMEVGRMSTP